MVLKLSEDVPIVWRTPTSVQLGVDAPRIVFDGLGAGQERLIAALRLGISRSGWEMLARDAGVTPEQAGAMLDTLRPVLSAEAPTAMPNKRHRVLVLGDGPIASALAVLLKDAGRLAQADGVSEEEPPAIVALVAAWVIGPEDSQRWLRRDVPHLPIVATDRGVTVGAIVEPGTGPCIYCCHLTRTDEDDKWPTIAAQLWGRERPRTSALTNWSAAGLAARLLLTRLDSGQVDSAALEWRLADEDGSVSSAPQFRHPRCSCAALPESDWAPVLVLAGPDATRRARSETSPA